jgi:phenylalanyl-tRNA synthetase beta chain
MSHLGIARELCILLNLPLKKQDYKETAGAGSTLKIKLEAQAEGCPRYTGRTVKNVKNTDSPAWLKERLLVMGVNPKNAVVDVTNYVLYAVGHPLHAFDADKLEAGEIIVRFAKEGEPFTGLDGIARTLSAQTLIIADGKKPVALAGVLGGAADSIGQETKNIFLESAWFYPPAINRTSKKLCVSTEASQRFERGVDIEGCAPAMALATKLITEICGGEVSEINDVYPVKYEAPVINFKPSEITKILGMDIADGDLKKIFSAMSPALNAEGDTWSFAAPSYRRDITQRWDLAEEAVRFYGFDKLAPGKISQTAATLYFGENPKNVDIGEKLSASLTALGFFECKNFDFLSLKDIVRFGFNENNTPQIKNPIAEGMDFMRPLLLPSLLKNLEYNHRQSRFDLALFEYGKTCSLQKGYPAEAFALCGVITGKVPRVKFFGIPQAPADFYYSKGIVENILKGFKNVTLKPSPVALSYMHPKICMDIIIEGKNAGFLGKVHPLVAKACDIQPDVWAFEFTAKALERQFDAQEFKTAEEISVFPTSKRDLSLVIDAALDYDKIRGVLASSAHGADYALIDLYQGKKITEGKKSITLRFEISSKEKTLTDAEINARMDTILTSLKSRLGAELRQ